MITRQNSDADFEAPYSLSALEGVSFSFQVNDISVVTPRLLGAVQGAVEVNTLQLPKEKLSKLSTSLYHLGNASEEVVLAQAASNGISVVGGYIVIDAISVAGEADELLSTLTQLGLLRGASFGNIVSGLLPLSALNSLDGVATLQSVRESLFQANAGDVTTQADASLLADDVRSQFNLDGAGVSIGVLSDSFDSLGGYADDIASGDLPALVNVLEDIMDGSDEGRAMLQIIHDIAPGAELLFHTAFLGIANFAQGILDLADAGADIIVDDVFYFAEPFFQDGIIAQAVDTVTAQGVLYYSSAGNAGSDSYEAFFEDSGITETGTFGAIAHDFDPGAGVDTRQLVTLGAGREIQLSFQFDEAFSSAGGVGPSSDYDIYLYEAGTDNIVASSTTSNANDAVEIFSFVNETGAEADYELVIARFSGATNNLLKYINFGSGTFQEYFTNSSTLVGHSNAAGAVAVGAAAFFNTPEFGVNPPVLEGFSSLGGTQILFDDAGNRLATPEDRGGALFTAPDGGNTTFFGNDIGADSDSFPNFFGTSASAPAAAAAAALLLGAFPDVTGAEINTAFVDTAIDIGEAGIDLFSGAGLIQVDAAFANLLASMTLIEGTTGDDLLIGNSIANEINAFEGQDTLMGGLEADTLNGGSGNDSLLGEDGVDILNGDEGDDILLGNLGNDHLFGGDGDDSLDGGDGNDNLDGGIGNDELSGGNQNDVLNGSAGNDTLFGNLGRDSLVGGDDDDLLLGGNRQDTLESGDGDDRAFGGNGSDTITGDMGNDILRGGTSEDTLDGGVGDDFLFGGTQNDILFGGEGADVLSGRGGFDTLNGGIGNDTLIGGFNGDIFIFEDSFGNDVIEDFTVEIGPERIDLSGVTEITDFADLVADHLSDINGNAVITDGMNTITLTGVAMVDLEAGDFIF